MNQLWEKMNTVNLFYLFKFAPNYYQNCFVRQLLCHIIFVLIAIVLSLPEACAYQGVTHLPDTLLRDDCEADSVNAHGASAEELRVMTLPDTLGIDAACVALSDSCSDMGLYAQPYSLMVRDEDYGRLGWNTLAFMGAGVTTLFVLELLPEGSTAWNKKALRKMKFFDRWWNHVKAGPVFDKDNAVFNYVLHPYGGAVYYMSARSNGFNALGSLLYCSFVSSGLWEYGIEAFMEIPSAQDLIITPLVGSVIGEGFYLAKRKIVRNGYRLCGSRVLGGIVAWLIDPINEFVGLFAGNPCRPGKKRVKGARANVFPRVTHVHGRRVFTLSGSIVF